ncbi:hypothetical protein GCM10022419_062080 [Nonomuraea rosea]|uniref:Uncharacterized protein n=1 Tax=Nonomuraea rosea TaxID=638574 RepID=A0ABP6XUE8_9ACTN
MFTLSKSRDVAFLDVINHIEKALNPGINAGTYPPFRPGDTTAGRDINLPPVKAPLGNELPKAIPGNYAKPPNTPEGYPLWRSTDTGYSENRAIFSEHPFSVPQDNFTMGKPGATLPRESEKPTACYMEPRSRCSMAITGSSRTILSTPSPRAVTAHSG